jgi:2-polyprenyl-6-methoxyphenol hydroxylase-like FAD-dependent oxidoreductase
MAAGRRVLIVGAGPTGLLTAFGLAKGGADVTVIDREPEVVASPRATVYLPSTLKVLDELGLLEEVLREAATGYVLQVRFRLTGYIGEVDHRLVSDLTPYGYTLHLGQHELAYLIMRRLLAFPATQVCWNTAFESLEQQPDVVAVRVSTPAGKQTLEFDWVIGADGARSVVRGAMGATFEGFTWPETFMATNVYYDFEDFGYAYSNLIADAASWAVVARLDSQEHYWRVSYSEDSALSEEERVARIPERYRYYMPEGRRWQLDRANSYRVHQRSASAYRIGRVLLAGDAAHATNPIGGMGLTSGIQDASALIQALSAVIAGDAGGDVLDWYAYERRRCFLEVANPTAIEFKRRAQEADPARRREDEAGFRAMQENREFARAGLMAIFALCSRPYRPDWRETLLVEDQSRGVAETVVLGTHATHAVTRDIE